jgi:hypothetical protein
MMNLVELDCFELKQAVKAAESDQLRKHIRKVNEIFRQYLFYSFLNSVFQAIEQRC